MKTLLQKHFENEYDYIIKNANNRAHGKGREEIITITPNCFKELCMISRTQKASSVEESTKLLADETS